MADTVDGSGPQGRGRLRDLASKAIAEHLVADAPDDYDQAMETVPVAPVRVRVLVLAAALLLSWTLIIVVVIALCCAVSKPRLKRVVPGAFYVERERPAAAASWRPPVRADLRPASPASAA